LSDMLRRIDQSGVFPRQPDQPTPFLLLDGHGSRLEVPFLSYINNPKHKWVVCIGVPNGTSLWQVGDSTEQNGCYKMYCSEYKTKLTSKKIEMGIFKLNLQRTDIIPIVNYAWARSFARIGSNIHARQARGWGPLNKVLLSHPDILCTKPKSLSSECDQVQTNIISNDTTVALSVCSTTSLSDSLDSQTNKIRKKGFDVKDINITDGFAGETLCTILRKLQRDHQTMENLDKTRKNGTDFVESMKNVRRWTAGVIFDHNKCYLDEEVLEVATSHIKKKEKEYWNKVRKHYNEYHKKKDDYEKAFNEYNKQNSHNNLPIKLLKPLCNWKKRKGDKKMPTKQNELLSRWEETKDRNDISLEEYMKTMTTLYETYKREHNGTSLTLELINEMMKGEDDVDIGGAVSIVQPNEMNVNSVEV